MKNSNIKLNQNIISILLIIILSALFTINVEAQSFDGGILFGASSSQIDGDVQSGYKKPGFFGGGFVKTQINENSAFYIEMYYIGKGASARRKDASGIITEDFRVSLHYVEMPIMYHFQLSEKFGLKSGVAPSYLFKSKILEYGSQLNDNYYDFKDIDIQAMIQADYSLNKKWNVNMRFSYSLGSIRKDIRFWYNNNLSIGLRYFI